MNSENRKKMFLLFSHTLTQKQEEEARKVFGIPNLYLFLLNYRNFGLIYRPIWTV